MKPETRMTKLQSFDLHCREFELWNSGFFRHSSFGLRIALACFHFLADRLKLLYGKC